MANIKQTVKLGVFTLAIMNVTAVVSLRGLPAEAVRPFTIYLQLSYSLYRRHLSLRNWLRCSRTNKVVCSAG